MSAQPIWHYARGRCRECGRECAVTTRRQIWTHFVDVRMCPGSGQRPAGDFTYEVERTGVPW